MSIYIFCDNELQYKVLHDMNELRSIFIEFKKMNKKDFDRCVKDDKIIYPLMLRISKILNLDDAYQLYEILMSDKYEEIILNFVIEGLSKKALQKRKKAT